jgi:hypothetical protein
MDFASLADGGDSHQARSGRMLKVLSGGVGLLVLAIVGLSMHTQNFHVASGTTPSNFIGLASARSSLAQPTRISLPGPSPWKELALAGMEGRSAIRNVMGSMGSKDKALVVRAAAAVNSKAKELAGITAPMSFFDPVGFSTDVDYGRLLFYREVEIKHGRVGMLASLGIIFAEKFHPLFGGNIDVPAYVAFQQTPLQSFWVAVAFAMAVPEIKSIQTFEPPDSEASLSGNFQVKQDRVPGDLGWDPLGLKPKDANKFLELQNKEINNGRLAMLAAAGMIAQELVTGKTIGASLMDLSKR